MKQKYYSVKHHSKHFRIWVTTIMSSKERLTKFVEEIKEEGRISQEIETHEFDNFFLHIPSEYLNFYPEGLTKLGESHNYVGVKVGNLWCHTEYKDHPEVVTALEEKMEKEGKAQASFYSQPWV